MCFARGKVWLLKVVSTFFLIRHGLHEFGAHRLAGRTPNVHLSQEGVRQAEHIAEILSRESIRRIYSSPLERTRETALLFGKKLNLPVQIKNEFIEVDFGDWTGRDFQELDSIPEWKQFNLFRSGTRVPGGEHILEIQKRAVNGLEELKKENPFESMVIVSHGDVIRSLIAYYLGIPLDLFQRIEVEPASISILTLEDYAPKIRCINRCLDLTNI
jgi:probable phosphomutase (TIGR03848 family)